MIGNTKNVSQSFCMEALKNADNERGKPTDRERNRIFGLSTIRQRVLLSNLCSSKNINFLEIGVYKGSTLISAMFDNPTVKAVGVEHYLYDDRESPKWAPKGFIWDNMKSQLEASLNIYRNEKDRLDVNNLTIIEKPFEEVDWSKQPKFDVVHFDVAPLSEKVYDDFFSLVVPSLATESVVVFTQQSNYEYAELLNKALLKYTDKVEERFKEYRVSTSMSDSFKYFSGIAMIGFKKKLIVKPTPKPFATKPVAPTVKPKANT
tara:strand:- start:5354 stop:6139 length:786 start_codon:yes stop_codon:yes gene_type:complete